MSETMKSTAMRLDSGTVEYVDSVSKLMKLDKSSVFRMILKRGIEEDRRERALELYTKKALSLEGAAKFSDMYVGDFLELMREKGIESNISLDYVKKGLRNLRKLR